MSRHHGADDERTLVVAAALRTALLKQQIELAAKTLPPFTEAERQELIALILGALHNP